MIDAAIRPVTARDIDNVHRLGVEWAEEDITYGQVATAKQTIADNLGPYFLVATEGDELVGYIWGSVHTSKGLAVIPAGEQYMEIDELYVKQAFRRSGIGGRMLDTLGEIARKRGVNRFKVYSAARDLDGAMRFYRGHGFQSRYAEMFI